MSEARRGPLTLEHARMIDRALERVQEGLSLAQRCTDCGLDVSSRISELEAVREIASSLKRSFFPERP